MKLIRANTKLKRWHRRPLHHECFATHQFKHKNEGIHEDDEDGNYGDTCRASRRVA